MKNIWSKKELSIVFQYRKEGTLRIMEELHKAGFNRSRKSVQAVATRKKIRLTPKYHEIWSDKEKQIMQTYYPKLGAYGTYLELKRLGFSKSERQIYDYARKFGIKVLHDVKVANIHRNRKPLNTENLTFTKRKKPEYAISQNKGKDIIKIGGKWLSYWKFAYEQKYGEPVKAGYMVVAANPDYPLSVYNMRMAHISEMQSFVSIQKQKQDRSKNSVKGWETRRRNRIKELGGVSEALAAGEVLTFRSKSGVK